MFTGAVNRPSRPSPIDLQEETFFIGKRDGVEERFHGQTNNLTPAINQSIEKKMSLS
jgi:hypothetical protein